MARRGISPCPKAFIISRDFSAATVAVIDGAARFYHCGRRGRPATEVATTGAAQPKSKAI